MNRSLILDLVVVSTIVVAIARGWSRRSIREAFALLGVAVGMLLVAVAVGPTSALIRLVSSTGAGSSRAIAASMLFVTATIVGTIVGYRIAKNTDIPAPRRLDASGGAAFAFVRILVVIAVLLTALDIAWGPQSVGHRMIADSVSGDVLISEESPFGAFYGSLLDRSPDLRAIEAWARRDDGGSVGYQQSQLEATDADLVLRPEAERAMLEAINEERRSQGLDPLSWCAACAEVARAHSKDMYRGGYFSHEDLNGDGPFDRMKAARISYGAAGENLALAPTVDEAHSGLMESPDHRANILRPGFHEVGIGIYEGPYGLMCTQLFRALP